MEPNQSLLDNVANAPRQSSTLDKKEKLTKRM